MFTISVIVPVRDEADFIAGLLVQLLDQDYPSDQFEVLVVDGQSTDATAAIVAQMASRDGRIRLLSNPKRLSSAARNVGIAAAQGDVILLVDGHCEIPDRHMLRRVAAALEQTGADCLGRPQPLDVRGATRLQRAIAAARSSWLGHHPDSCAYSPQLRQVPAESVAVAYRREVFSRVGFFDEHFDACEDVELNHRIDRAGMACYFVPELAVRYVPRNRLGGLFRQFVRYGRGRVRLARKHPETVSWGSLMPAALLAGAAMGLLPAVVSQAWGAAYLVTVAAYLGMVLLTSFMIGAGRRSLTLLGLLPVVFLTIHAASGWGVWRELLEGAFGNAKLSTIKSLCERVGR